MGSRRAAEHGAASGIGRLAEDRVEEAGELLARAFHADSFSRYVVPDPVERADSLPFIYEVGVRYGALFGEVYAMHDEDDSLVGVAVWLPPGEHRTKPERTVEAGYLELAELVDPEPLQRFAQVQGHLTVIHERDAPIDHWYLTLIGVDPARQGQGVGSALLRPVMARADAAGVSCYLETFAEANLAFYARHGFVVVTAGIEPTSGIRFWTMRHDPPPNR